VARIEREGRQYGTDVRVEVLFEKSSIVGGVIGRLDNEDALGRKLRPKPLNPEFREFVEHGCRPGAGRRFPLLEADHKELVQVVGSDREKLDALEQGVVPLRLIEDTGVER
jgi:hypothetical protein